MDLFRVRLNCVDSYQSLPTKFDPKLRRNVPSQSRNEPKVPVIRVFGATETGQKVCAHIHGSFPYCYIEYTGSLNEDKVDVYIHRLHLSIDHALAVSYRRNMYNGKVAYVARITLVKGVPFYGFHVGYRYYLKIYLLDPNNMTRMADLLRQGVVMKQIFQPYESHIQFIPQWMMDYNLFGCGYVDCSKAYFRAPVPLYDETEDLSHLWHDRSVPKEYITKEDTIPRVSHCSIEVDIYVQDILNRKDIQAREIHNDFNERLNPLPPGEKLVHSMAGLWRDETRRRKAQMKDPSPGSSPFPPEVLVSMSADPRNSQTGGWAHEEEYMEAVRSLITEELDNSDGSKLSFDTFVKQTPGDLEVKTALDSVEDLYPENLRPILGLNAEALEADIHVKDGLEIDEDRLYDFNKISEASLDAMFDSDEEVMRGFEISQKRIQDRIEMRVPDPTEQPPVKTTTIENPQKDDVPDQSNFSSANSYKSDDGPTSSADSSLQPLVEGEPLDGVSAPPRDGSPLHNVLQTTRDASGVKRSHTVSGDFSKFKRQRIDTLNGDTDLENGRAIADDTSALVSSSPSTPNGVPHQLSSAHTVADEVDVNSPETDSRSVFVEAKSESSTQSPEKRLPKSDQDTLKAPNSTSTLKFPVVKDPQNPSTILRLSQNSSQKSNGSPPKRKVFFDLSDTPSQEVIRSPSASKSEESAKSSTSSMVPSQVLENMSADFGIVPGTEPIVYSKAPPVASFVLSTLQDHRLPSAIYQDAYYSQDTDVPERPRIYAGREFKIESTTVPFLPDFDPTGTSAATYGEKPGIVWDKQATEKVYARHRRACTLRSWEIAESPPTFADVEAWQREEEAADELRHTMNDDDGGIRVNTSRGMPGKAYSQIDGPTQKNRHGFKYTQKEKSTSVQHETHYMSTMSLEVHVNTRGNFVPNPEEDEVQCVFWCLQDGGAGQEATRSGVVVLSEDGIMAKHITTQTGLEVREETSELDLLVGIVEVVKFNDPDILTGYEVHGSSWGFLMERARLHYDYNICDEFSRMKTQSHGRFGKDSDKWGFNTTSTIRVTGRHMINIWRAMRAELNLLQYTMENVAFHLLHRRIPHYPWRDLTTWYTSGRAKDIAKVLEYYVSRVHVDLDILQANELISRTSEQARLLGVDFFSVFSRGSQFKVESLMFRIAKPENFILISPSRKQVGGQNPLVCLPLVMEPQSAFYNSPLLVLDFQSLYPSVMIAYNYCYSTFLGRTEKWRGTNKMGFAEYERQQRVLELLKDHINVAPNGIIYARPEIRKSLLAKMLGEILETRVMVKSGMKQDKGDKTLQQLLNNRQLALKLIANVTYGYTSASFSGRMPCTEIADSIVQTGRETLEKAIALIHSVKRWGAEVVYGDTDSIFVYLKGRTKDQAFDIGNEIAKTITNINPRPMKLKFEKVYFPCVLLAKKRYVGFKYESRDQLEPEFDAKGIETVRRDGTPAEQKIEEKALKILFRTADLSQVKSYFQAQCEKIMRGSVSIQDFCFAKEVRLGTYSDKGPPPPGALISTKRMLEDARAEPQYGERVPYVVVVGAPGARLIDRCVSPEELLRSEHSELDAEYYISKNLIPPLERIFNLVGANVRQWYDEMPKLQRIRRVDANLQRLAGSESSRDAGSGGKKTTLESYMRSSACFVCRRKVESEAVVCADCAASGPAAWLSLRTRLALQERKTQALERVCQSCSGIAWNEEVKCDSKDCPVFYSRTKQWARLRAERSIVSHGLRALAGASVNAADLEW